MTPGLCLDSGEFIPAAELNRRIDMSNKPWPEWNQEAERNRARNEAQAHIDAEFERIKDLETEIIEQSRIVGMGAERELALLANFETAKRRIAELEAQLAGSKEANRYYSDHCNVVANEHMQYQKRISELHTQLAVALYEHPPPAQPITSRQEPVAWRFTQNRGSGKTEYTYHDNTVENNHKLAYKDNCLKIEELYLHALPPEAPAQPIASWQEPVAKVISANDGPNSNPVVVWIVNFLGRTSNIKEGDWLFTRPAPAREPLSDDQIANACKHLLCVHPNAQTTLDIARAIEAEHNIKEKP